MDKLPQQEKFRHTRDGKETDLYYLRNNSAVRVAISNYGARIVSLIAPARDGSLRDVVVGFDSIDGYLAATEEYHGAIVGRYANRIAKGRFTLDQKEFQLACNNNGNHLHGGVKGFHDVVWEVDSQADTEIVLSYISPDGDEAYPGTLRVQVTYTLTAAGDLVINFEATSDRDTIVNLTNHAYFNLNGVGSGSIGGHTVMILASRYTPIDASSIPLGTLESVEGTPFDFRTPQAIGLRIGDDHQQIKNGGGYDHNFVLDKPHANELTLAARAAGNESGLVLEVLTTEPGLQFYSGNFMQGQNRIKGNAFDIYRSGFCLETQHFPDSPNHPPFPSTVLKEGEVFRSETIFRLFTEPG